MKTAILLGAGSSLAAGFPSTQHLTDLVLSGEGVWRHTDEVYYTAVPSNPSSQTNYGRTPARLRRLVCNSRSDLPVDGHQPRPDEGLHQPIPALWHSPGPKIGPYGAPKWP